MAKNIAWTVKEIGWIRENRSLMTCVDLTRRHNEEFPGKQRTYYSIRGAIVRFAGDRRPYRRFTEEQMEWIASNSQLPKGELGMRFRKKFRSSKSDASISAKRLALVGVKR